MNRFFALVPVVALLLAGCNTLPKSRHAGAVAPAKTSDPGHMKEVAAAQSELDEDVLRTPDSPTRWDAELRGEVEDQSLCELKGRYDQLKTFIDRHSEDGTVKLSELNVDKIKLKHELHKRGIAYIGHLVKMARFAHIPACLGGAALEYGNADIILGITRELQELTASPTEIGVLPSELRGFYLREVKKSVPALLVDYRSKQTEPQDGISKREKAISRLVELVQDYHFTAEELGIPAGDFIKFADARHYGEGVVCLVGECPKGDER